MLCGLHTKKRCTMHSLFLDGARMDASKLYIKFPFAALSRTCLSPTYRIDSPLESGGGASFDNVRETSWANGTTDRPIPLSAVYTYCNTRRA